MTPVFVDTSYYLALVNPADVDHESAKVFSVGQPLPFVTTAWVLGEVANSLSNAGQRRSFVLLYERIQQEPLVTVVPPTRELFDAGIAFYARHQDKDWSLTDCVSFLVMKEHGIRDALTTDHHFEQAGFRALLR